MTHTETIEKTEMPISVIATSKSPRGGVRLTVWKSMSEGRLEFATHLVGLREGDFHSGHYFAADHADQKTPVEVLNARALRRAVDDFTKRLEEIHDIDTTSEFVKRVKTDLIGKMSKYRHDWMFADLMLTLEKIRTEKELARWLEKANHILEERHNALLEELKHDDE